MTSFIRRIAAPGEVLPLWKRGAPLYRTPGNYLEVDLSPRYFLTPTMTFGLRYHLWSKGQDSYELQPLDPEALAAAVRQVIQNGPPEMGRRARSMVEASHSWETTFRRLFDLYAKRREPRVERDHVHQPA